MSTYGAQPQIGWQLYKATKQALDTFRMHLPKGALRPDVAGDPDEAEKLYVRDWAGALFNVTLDAIPDAASRWLRDEEHLDRQGRMRIPTIAGFARYARLVDLTEWRAPHLRIVPAPSVLSGRIHTLTTRAIAALGSREHAESVWGVLLQRAAAGVDAQRVREGRVTDAEFSAALDCVRARLEAEPSASAGGHRA